MNVQEKLFVVDEEKCKHDGICVACCPMGIIEMKDEKTAPGPVPGAEALCIRCGHCVAVCPHGALSLQSMSPEDCYPLKKKMRPTPDQIKQLMLGRRSIRHYKEKAVDKDTLSELIDIARYAPSAHNAQPVHWTIVHSADEVQKLAGMVVDWMREMVNEENPSIELPYDLFIKAWDTGADVICRNAPHLVITHGLKENPMAPTDSTIALTYFELAAASFGFGTCWAGLFRLAATLWEPLMSALKLPEEHIILGSMVVGFPKYKYSRIPLRNEANIIWR